MSLRETRDETLKEIVHIIEDWTDRDKKQLLRQLKMKRALRVARKIDKSPKEKILFGDLEIAALFMTSASANKFVADTHVWVLFFIRSRLKNIWNRV